MSGFPKSAGFVASSTFLTTTCQLVKGNQQRLRATCKHSAVGETTWAVLPEPRYGYYRLYDEDGALASKTSFDSEDSSLGRIDTHSIAPPQTVSSLSFQVTKAEGFATRTIKVYQDMDGEVLMTNNDHLPLQAQAYPGHLEDEPITIVFGQENSMTPLSAVDLSLLTQIRGGVAWNPSETHQAD